MINYNLVKNIKVQLEFDKYPTLGEWVIVLTDKGETKAKYTRWDWSDTSETPYFEDEYGNELKLITCWRYPDD